MSQSARIQELPDSEGDSDPEVEDISSLAPPSTATRANPSLVNPSHIPTDMRSAGATPLRPSVTPAETKHWVCLYPIYFDASRSVNGGRRVNADLAVQNPLARTIADAVATLQLRCVFDPSKTHPKDWDNPGRVKVDVKGKDGNWTAKAKGVANKRHLFLLIGKYLKDHPTTPQDPLKVQIRGMPEQTEPLPPPAVPRGWKVNSIVPLHSPAVTGGGVSENFLKDMMAEMQGLPPGQGGSGSGGEVSKTKKEKGKKKK